MLTAVAKTAGGFDYAGEYYTACCAFFSGTDPSKPSKELIPPNEQNIDRQLKVTGNSKMNTGEGLIIKAKRDRAELQNCYVPLLTNDVFPSYPNSGSGQTCKRIQEICIQLSGLCGFTLDRRESFGGMSTRRAVCASRPPSRCWRRARTCVGW
jgi:hypothetical protein